MTQNVRYVALQTATQGVQLQGKTLYAEHGVLTLNAVEAAELDELLASGKRPDICQAFRKIDEEAAKNVVAHVLAGQGQQGHQGTYNSQVHPARSAQEHTFENTKAALTSPGPLHGTQSGDAAVMENLVHTDNGRTDLPDNHPVDTQIDQPNENRLLRPANPLDALAKKS